MKEITIRSMTRDDIPFADTLRSLAGWNQTLQDWVRLLDCQPDGCFVAYYEDMPAATLTTTCFQDRLAWIGMVLTHPDLRRRGIAGALMKHALEFLVNKGVSVIKLDATPQGEPLYEQLGFYREYNLRRWNSSSWIAIPPQDSPYHVSPLADRDWDEVVNLDREAFEASRRSFLRTLSRQSEKTLLVWDKNNTIGGFGMIRPGMIADYLGPLMARSFEMIPPLVAALTADKAGHPLFWDIPDFQTETTAFAQQLGLHPLRDLVRMYFRRNIFPGKPHLVFGISDPATG